MSGKPDETLSVKNVADGEFEFFVDDGLFPKEAIMKAIYPFLDRCYFFLRRCDGGLLVRCIFQNKKTAMDAETMAGILSGSILDAYLRERVTSENREIREKLVSTAIEHSLKESMVFDGGEENF